MHRSLVWWFMIYKVLCLSLSFLDFFLFLVQIDHFNILLHPLCSSAAVFLKTKPNTASALVVLNRSGNICTCSVCSFAFWFFYFAVKLRSPRWNVFFSVFAVYSWPNWTSTVITLKWYWAFFAIELPLFTGLLLKCFPIFSYSLWQELENKPENWNPVFSQQNEFLGLFSSW